MNENKKRIFIALEGIDGSGKSTQTKFLKAALEAKGYPVHTTFEPTDSKYGKMIRDIFSHKEEADQKVIAALFVTDRLNHILDKKEGMLQQLDNGIVVISDRYYLSSYAYHSVYMPMQWVIDANAMAASILRPTVNIYIDMLPEVSMERILQSRENIEMYETLDHLQKVRSKYEEAITMVKQEENVVRINGNRTPEEVAKDIWTAVQAYL